ncbi:uncharacterized protein B0T23DRAFT_178582 [Neurospora hispaniola]|uniref:Uncharacterized protein n=1 Tax=Neurospora hispaniola TaxID=588809 RepID=A0AAJ0I6T1_9PEZI|nr:hypothetical protein B0T23DRAFT_178582 [Neurospora hispaniola]
MKSLSTGTLCLAMVKSAWMKGPDVGTCIRWFDETAAITVEGGGCAWSARSRIREMGSFLRFRCQTRQFFDRCKCGGVTGYEEQPPDISSRSPFCDDPGAV